MAHRRDHDPVSEIEISDRDGRKEGSLSHDDLHAVQRSATRFMLDDWGLICVGPYTGRIGMELGYHVTLVRDGTAARSPEAMHAALDIDGPTYAHAILTRAELVSALKSSP